MKRRLTPIVTVSLALIFIGSLAYAADRRKQAKQVRQPVDPVHEEESLRAELLAAVDDHDKKPGNTAKPVKVAAKSEAGKADKTDSGK